MKYIPKIMILTTVVLLSGSGRVHGADRPVDEPGYDSIDAIRYEEDLTKAIRSTDWIRIREVLRPVFLRKGEVFSPRPIVSSMLYAHASLALGYNDDAIRLFYENVDDPSLNLEWYDWCRRLLAVDESSYAAKYFIGDALARNGRVEEAIEFFEQVFFAEEDSGTQLSEQLAYMNANALGVAYLSASGKLPNTHSSSVEPIEVSSEICLERAFECFDRSIEISQKAGVARFSAPIGNQALYFALTGGRAETVQESYQKALDANPEDSMALVGMAVGKGMERATTTEILSILDKASPDSSNPFLAYNRASLRRELEGFAELSSARGATGRLDWNLGGHFDTKAFTPIGLTNVGLDFNIKRGGVYIAVEEGENLVVRDHDSPKPPVLVGVWTNLNY